MRDSPVSPFVIRELSARYASSMAYLVDVARAASEVRDVPALARVITSAARELLGSDGATFLLRDGDDGQIVEQSAATKVWKGRRFPLTSTITGTAVLTGQPVIVADMEADPRIPGKGRTPDLIGSLLVVPIRVNAPLGAIAINWMQRRQPSEEDVAILQALADTTSVAWENVRLFDALQDKITNLEAQQVRIQSQHESLEVFARALAHDLKEPVRTVRAFSELIATGEDPPQTRDAYFELIRRAADRMGMLIDTVYQYTQLEDPGRLVRRPCDMNQVIGAVTANLAQLIRERGAHVDAGPLPVVLAHTAHMTQLLQNLIANAIRHGPHGVRVDIRAEDQGDHWRFSVTDNGPGLAPGDHERIFQPFRRLNLNEEGAGLGLAICRKVVTLHGGRIWCESAPTGEGTGARFVFTLAKTSQGAEPAVMSDLTHGTPMQHADARLANVLLVDDREADVELTRVLLQVRDRLQCNLLVARGGQEALDTVRATQARGDRIDLLLLDINMPGMDGFEMLEKLRADSAISRVAVVMCSGSTYDDDLQRAQKLGASGYMVKPPSLEQLIPMLAGIPDLHLDRDGSAARLLRTN